MYQRQIAALWFLAHNNSLYIQKNPNYTSSIYEMKFFDDGTFRLYDPKSLINVERMHFFTRVDNYFYGFNRLLLYRPTAFDRIQDNYKHVYKIEVG